MRADQLTAQHLGKTVKVMYGGAQYEGALSYLSFDLTGRGTDELVAIAIGPGGEDVPDPWGDVVFYLSADKAVEVVESQ